MAVWVPISEIFTTSSQTLTDPLIVAQISGNNGTAWTVGNPLPAYASQLGSGTQIRIGVDVWDDANEIGINFGEGNNYVNIWGDYGGNPRTISGLSISWSSFTLSTVFPYTGPTHGLLELDIHFYLDAAPPEQITHCILYKNTGIGFRNPSIPQPPSTSLDGSSVRWTKPVTSASGRWLDPVRPGVTRLRSSSVSSRRSTPPETSASDSLFLLSNNGTALIVEKGEGIGSVVTGKGDVKVPVYENESQE